MIHAAAYLTSDNNVIIQWIMYVNQTADYL